MNSIDALLDLVDYNAWANQAALASLETIAPDARIAPLRTFAHVLAAERLWLDRIDGDAGRRDVHAERTLAECREEVALTARRLDDLLRTLDESRLDTVVDYHSLAGDPFASSLREIITHMQLHAMYHRGQIAAVVRAAGGAPAATDYILWRRSMASHTSAHAAARE